MSIAELKRPEASHIWQREEHEHYVEPEWCSRRCRRKAWWRQAGFLLVWDKDHEGPASIDWLHRDAQ